MQILWSRPVSAKWKKKPVTQREFTFLCEILCKMCVLIQGPSNRKKGYFQQPLSIGGTCSNVRYLWVPSVILSFFYNFSQLVSIPLDWRLSPPSSRSPLPDDLLTILFFRRRLSTSSLYLHMVSWFNTTSPPHDSTLRWQFVELDTVLSLLLDFFGNSPR